jgi:D-alanyl-D-alanine carboxypeptidase (penicillin-binding protein 5/6)
MIRAALTFATLLCTPLAAAAFETKATAAYVVDQTTGTVLLAKNADTPVPPASMSKLMTLYMLFDALRDGRVTLDEEFSVSTKAKNMGGSTMFLNELDRPTAEELIQGIVVSSGNDATVVVAEGLAGTEDAFARLMNEEARQIGMTQSTFVNASGWPAAGHVMSMRDLGILSQHLIEEFPEYYTYFAQTEFDYKDRSPANRFNRNPLLGLGIGADGLKTGHTQEAGYGLAGSAKQGDRRVIFAITGLETQADRARESEAIVNWAFRQFSERPVARAGARLAEAEVWMGSEPRVGLVAPKDYTILFPATAGTTIEADIVYQGPLKAPIAAGDPVAELVFAHEGMPEVRLPLVAETDVPEGGFLSRVSTAAIVLYRQLRQGLEEAS